MERFLIEFDFKGNKCLLVICLFAEVTNVLHQNTVRIWDVKIMNILIRQITKSISESPKLKSNV